MSRKPEGPEGGSAAGAAGAAAASDSGAAAAAATTTTTTLTMTDDEVGRLLGSAFPKGVNPISLLLDAHELRVSTPSQSVTLRFRTKTEHSNGTTVQGGIVAAMLDMACAMLILGLTRLEQGMVSLEQKCTYLEPISPKGVELECTAKLLKKGNRVAFCDAALRRVGEDKILATASQTCMLIPGPAAQRRAAAAPASGRPGAPGASRGSQKL